jgi:hypothetical protein
MIHFATTAGLVLLIAVVLGLAIMVFAIIFRRK